MADIDELTNLMTESKVDPSALGQHPRFCQYKNVEKAAEQQADRRRDALERQRNRRLDAQNHMRNLAENLESDEDEEEEEKILEEKEQTEAMDFSMRKERRRNRYDNELMTSEWLVDIPEKLSDEWMMVPSPVGRRVLVVATAGITTAYSKGGRLLHQFKSQLPCRSGRYTILDCILAGQTFYILDILCWSGNVYYDFPFDNRRFFLQSHVEENAQLAVSTKASKFVFKPLPACKCEKKEMENMMSTEFDFDVDGLLFYHSQVLYVAGQSPLVGWLKPFMLPDVLGVEIAEKYLATNAEKLSANEYIEKYNKKHKHVSRFGKETDDEMSSTR